MGRSRHNKPADLPVSSLLTPWNPVPCLVLHILSSYPSGRFLLTLFLAPPAPGVEPILCDRSCACAATLFLLPGAREQILSPAPHGARTSVLSRIRFRGTGCFALPLCWSVTRWFADGDGLANSVSAVQTTIITRAIPWRTGCTGRPHRRIHSNTGTIWKTTRTATRNSTYLPALGDSAQATRYRCRQL